MSKDGLSKDGLSKDGMSKDGRKISPVHVTLKAGVNSSALESTPVPFSFE